MTSYFQIDGGLFLVRDQVPQYSPTSQSQPTNHLWLVDRSGSMWSELPELITQLQRVIYCIPQDDTLSFGYFSGEGTFSFPIKGFQLNSDDDYRKLERLFEQHKTTLNLTCFSEILTEANVVVDDLTFLTNRAMLWLFTDGYPVVKHYQKEVESIRNALETLNPKLVGSVFVGYGDYYNQDLMNQMAGWAGGSLEHSSDLLQTARNLNKYTTDVQTFAPRRNVHLPVPVTTVFTVSPLQFFTPASRESLFLPDNVEDYFYLSTSPVGNEIFKLSSDWEPALYAAAIALIQVNRSDLATDTLSCLGDTYLAELMNNAFTTAELGVCINELTKAVAGEGRFRKGRKQELRPSDCTSVLDILYVLEAGNNQVLPYHPEFKYSRSGPKTTPREGYPVFTPDPDVKAPFSLTWHSARLNANLQLRIPGTIDLGEAAIEVQLPELFHTHIYRNYSVIADGALKLKALPVLLDEDSFNTLVAMNVLTGDYSPQQVIHLESYPLISRAYADASADTSILDFAALVVEQEVLKGEMKALKYYYDQLTTGQSKLSKDFLPEQREFLSERGITQHGFSPPVDTLKTGDYYFARVFECTVKGFSSLPKVTDVVAKLEGQKKLTQSDKAVEKGITLYRNFQSRFPEQPEALTAALEAEIRGQKQRLNSLRGAINEIKFTLSISRRWFKDSQREDSLEVKANGGEGFGDLTVKFHLGEEKVNV